MQALEDAIDLGLSKSAMPFVEQSNQRRSETTAIIAGAFAMVNSVVEDTEWILEEFRFPYGRRRGIAYVLTMSAHVAHLKFVAGDPGTVLARRRTNHPQGRGTYGSWDCWGYRDTKGRTSTECPVSALWILRLSHTHAFSLLTLSGKATNKMDRYVGIEPSKIIGSGSYGVVYKVRDKVTHQTLALKTFIDETSHCAAKSDATTAITENQNHSNRASYGVPYYIIREVSVLKELRHDNIVRLIDCVTDESTGALSLVFEYMETDLHRFLHDSDGILAPRLVRSLLQQCLRGIACCHQSGVLHRGTTREEGLQAAL
jgi:Protein kinase domain